MGVVTSVSGELARTADQRRLQAHMALEGSYLDVTADHARSSPAMDLPRRTPTRCQTSGATPPRRFT